MISSKISVFSENKLFLVNISNLLSVDGLLFLSEIIICAHISFTKEYICPSVSRSSPADSCLRSHNALL